MSQSSVNVSSITYAQRSRDILESKGYNVHFEKTHSPANGSGCGYTVYSNASRQELLAILNAAGIKIIAGQGGGQP